MEQVTTTPSTPTGSKFQQALAETRAETSVPAEQPATPPASPETVPASPPNEPPAPASEPPAAATPPDELISDSELAALQTKHADDPAALAKALKGAFTQKTQALAAQRKADADDLAFAKAFKADPVGAITRHGQALGLSVKPTEAERREVQTQQTATTIADAMMTKFTAALGPDLEFIAPQLGAAMRVVAEETAKAIVSQQVEPIKSAQQQILDKAAKEIHETTWKNFETKHPDWQTHEKAMIALGEKLRPNGMDEGEYMDLLYSMVTRDQEIAARAQAAIDKMTQGAQTAEAATRTVPASAIQAAPRKIRNFRDAYEATKEEQARAGAR